MSGKIGIAPSWKALLAVAFWGASFVYTRIALESFGPYGLIAVRSWLGLGLLLVALRFRRRGSWPAGSDLRICVALGLVMAVHLLLQAHGLRYTSAIHTGWIIGVIPVMVALGAHWLGRQRIGGGGWFGVMLGVLGVGLVTIRTPPDFGDARFGDSLQIVSCFTWTIYTLAATGVVSRRGSLKVSVATLAVAAIGSTAAAAWFGWMSGPLNGRALGSALFLGFFCTGLAQVLWLSAQDDHGPTRVGSLLYFEPLVTLAVAATVLHEPITSNALLGGMAVLVGVWIVALGTRKPENERIRDG